MSKLRKEVEWFAEEMEKTLQANDHKGGWYNCEMGWLLRRVGNELGELRRAWRKKEKQAVIKECTDVANFCMMLATLAQDNRYDQLKDTPTREDV